MNARQGISKLVFVTTLLVILCIANLVLAAGQNSIRKFPIPEHGTLDLNVPTPWISQLHKPTENMPPTIILNPAKGDDFKVMITVLRGRKGEQDFNRRDKVRAFVEKDSKKLIRNAVEPNIVLQEIKGINDAGYYFSITDKAPNPGEYRYMTRGAIGVGDLLLNFTILHRVKDAQSVRDGLAILREAKQSQK